MLCCLSSLTRLPSTLLNFCMSRCGISVISCSVVGLYLLRWWCKGGRCYSKARLDNKTVIITGANIGIGKETAKDFVRRGARVILACRDMIKGEMAAAEIRCCGKRGGSAIVKKLDLASLKSIRKFCEDILETELQINILVNNAGVMWCPEWKTEDGFEMQMGTNHLGHFLLTNLLLDKIKASAPSRIVVVSSILHEKGVMNFNNINLTGEYDPLTAYNQSKLANVLFARELAKILKGTTVSVFSLHPGVIMTNLSRHFLNKYPFFHYILAVLGPILYKYPEEGAQTSIYCAVQEGIEDQSGLYFSDCKVKEAAPQARDDGAAKKLWEISEKMTDLIN